MFTISPNTSPPDPTEISIRGLKEAAEPLDQFLVSKVKFRLKIIKIRPILASDSLIKPSQYLLENDYIKLKIKLSAAYWGKTRIIPGQ